MGLAYRNRQARNKKANVILTKMLMFFLVVGFVSAVLVSIFLYYLSKGLPDVEQMSVYVPNETTKLYSADGVILAELHKEENRMQVQLSDISASLKVAVVALEDARFYKHHGVDFKAIMRAIVKDIMHGGAVQGASTLTQQLARNVFLTKKKTIIRKISEILLAVQIERRYTKDEILEMYLNQVYWGHNAYGIESASQLYFGKDAKELSISESAMLVGLLKGPELYSPYKNFKAAKRRQKIVLGRLLILGYINQDQYDRYYKYEVVLTGRKKIRYKAPYFTSYIVKQLIELYGEDAVYSSGMKVYTSLNYKMQKYAEKAVDYAVEMGKKPLWMKGEKIASANFSQAALLSVDPKTGYILAMVGGHDFLSSEYNKALQANRQPGSLFKPFNYLTALDKGLSPGTIIDDSPVTFNTIEGPYSPQNYNHKFRGPMSLRKGLELSENVVAIKVIDLIGPENVVETAKKLGLENADLKPILSLTLGACEVKMIDLAYAFGVIANSGVKAKPLSILKIEDRNGIEMERYRSKTERVFKANVVNALVEMMKGVVNYGTGRNARLPRPMAGKTGTTTDYKDAWFIGFVPQMVTVTWIGNDNNTPMNYMTGGYIPALTWKKYMRDALRDIKVIDFPKPKGLVPVKVCWDSGLRATEFCPNTEDKHTDRVHVEKYWRGSLPKSNCNIHISYDTELSKPKINYMNDIFGE